LAGHSCLPISAPLVVDKRRIKSALFQGQDHECAVLLQQAEFGTTLLIQFENPVPTSDYQPTAPTRRPEAVCGLAACPSSDARRAKRAVRVWRAFSGEHTLSSVCDLPSHRPLSWITGTAQEPRLSISGVNEDAHRAAQGSVPELPRAVPLGFSRTRESGASKNFGQF
jgi:hypothetical protein